MSSKPKVLFVYDHPKPEWLMDGLWAALNLLEEDFEIERLNLSKRRWPVGGYDFVLGWGAFGSRVDHEIHAKEIGHTPSGKGLCIAGSNPPVNANNYDVLFYESTWYQQFIGFHPNIHRAFGVNTDLFSPSPVPTPVVWDYLGVGALANWKRWEKMTEKTGSRLVIGEYQKDNELESWSIAGALLRGGVMVSPMVSPLDLVNVYHWSRKLYMPAEIMGGGERAIWEARSCGLEVEVEEDNPKLQEFVTGEIKSHHDYAAALKKGILSVL